jgi:hypothetical protein
MSSGTVTSVTLTVQVQDAFDDPSGKEAEADPVSFASRPALRKSSSILAAVDGGNEPLRPPGLPKPNSPNSLGSRLDCRARKMDAEATASEGKEIMTRLLMVQV